MQTKQTAVATLLVCALAVPVVLTARNSESSPATAGGTIATAQRAASLTPFLGLKQACDRPYCPEMELTSRKAVTVVVGDRYADAHLVSEPGLYGLSDPPRGEAYAVVGSKLVRIDRDSRTVLSVLRDVEGIRD